MLWRAEQTGRFDIGELAAASRGSPPVVAAAVARVGGDAALPAVTESAPAALADCAIVDRRGLKNRLANVTGEPSALASSNQLTCRGVPTRDI